MEFFFATPTADAHVWSLGADELRHCVRTLRHRAGDEVHAIDGKGLAAQCVITQISEQEVLLRVLKRLPDFGEPPVETHLLFPLLKHKERTEWMLEKAVELGVTHLHPIRHERSEPLGLPAERTHRILLAAVKQCLRSRLPYVSPIRPIKEAVMQANLPPRRYLFGATAEHPFSHDLQQLTGNAVVLAVGPEGDFTPNEWAAAQAAGFAFVSLGATRLRAETAAIHVLSLNKSAQGF